MKRLIRRFLPLLLAACLSTALCGCEDPYDRGNPSAAVQDAEQSGPERTEGRLELDGTALGPVFELAGVPYVEAESLRKLWALDLTETDGKLVLTREDATLTFGEGSAAAQTEKGAQISLGAAALRRPEGWYLPVSALETLWGRILVRDEAENVLRCLRVSDGPEILLNGVAALSTCRWNEIPVLSAAELANACGGSMESGTDPEGVPLLTLRAGDHALTVRAGSTKAELDGSPTVLPVPARQTEAAWNLPAAAVAEALGWSAYETETPDRLSLLREEPGPSCWFSGVGLGPTRRVNEVLCGELSVLAEAAGGTVSEKNGVLTLTTPSHILTLRPCDTQAKADGVALTLPLPVLPAGETWLVPLESVGAALGLSGRTESFGVVYSDLTPCETLIWLNGRQTQAYTRPDGGLYVKLAEANAQVDGCFLPTGNDAVLQTRDGELALRAGSTACTARGENVQLSAPTLVEGTDWYVSAPEVLPALGLTELVDPELDQRYYTHVVKNSTVPTGYRVPVLMYHAVSDHIWGNTDLFVSPSELEKQIQAMLEAGYMPITFEELDHVDEIEKPVLMTFDDGYDDNYTELFPILQKYNVKATIFIIVNDIGARHKMTREQIKELSDSGLVSIQSHTMSHNYLDWMNETQLRYEHYDSLIALARITGKQPFVMCYPTGKNSAFSRTITAEYYEYGLNMTGPCYVTGDAPYRIYRFFISRYTGLQAFMAKLAG